jgi:hypothetical protein
VQLVEAGFGLGVRQNAAGVEYQLGYFLDLPYFPDQLCNISFKLMV